VDRVLTAYIAHPHPVWQPEVAEYLIAHRQHVLNESLSAAYSTVQTVKGYESPTGRRIELIAASAHELPVFLEAPDLEHMADFYCHHGLEPIDAGSDEWLDSIGKLKAALAVVEQVSTAYQCIRKLVRCIQVVRSEHYEIDVSYSHPDIPYTIFVSVCEDDSPVSNLRVAESIIHETMHLKLTLLEKVIPLVKPDSTELFYSPWRDEMRPIQGVLHGLYVFRGVLDLYAHLHVANTGTQSFLNTRIKEIGEEIKQVLSFPQCLQLTLMGASLSKNLLPSN